MIMIVIMTRVMNIIIIIILLLPILLISVVRTMVTEPFQYYPRGHSLISFKALSSSPLAAARSRFSRAMHFKASTSRGLGFRGLRARVYGLRVRRAFRVSRRASDCCCLGGGVGGWRALDVEGFSGLGFTVAAEGRSFQCLVASAAGFSVKGL